MSTDSEATVSLRFCAMQYLNLWHTGDRHFTKGLEPLNKIQRRIRALGKAAHNYRIDRNFPTFSHEKTRSRILEALDRIDRPRVQDVDTAVSDLAKKLEKIAGKYLVSAASKLLWLKYRDPVVILDGMAIRGLASRIAGRAADLRDYPAYRRTWLEEFAKERDPISRASKSLVEAKLFSAAFAQSDEGLRATVAKSWFHRRIFDQLLWWTGTSISKERTDDGVPS